MIPLTGAFLLPLAGRRLADRRSWGFLWKSLYCFDKTTGEAVWTSQDDAPSYASPIAITVFDTRQIVFFPATGLVGVAAKDGQPCGVTHGKRVPMSMPRRLVFLAPDRLFISSGYGKGAAVIQLISQNDQISIKKVCAIAV